MAGSKDHLFVLHHQLVAQEELDRLGQDLTLQVLTPRLDGIEGILTDPDMV
jgi:hypothetical protein